MGMPYVSFSGDELKNQPAIKKGDEIICPKCGMLHKIFLSTDVKSGIECDLAGLYKCGEDTKLATIAGKLVIGLKTDCGEGI